MVILRYINAGIKTTRLVLTPDHKDFYSLLKIGHNLGPSALAECITTADTLNLTDNAAMPTKTADPLWYAIQQKAGTEKYIEVINFDKRIKIATELLDAADGGAGSLTPNDNRHNAPSPVIELDEQKLPPPQPIKIYVIELYPTDYIPNNTEREMAHNLYVYATKDPGKFPEIKSPLSPTPDGNAVYHSKFVCTCRTDVEKYNLDFLLERIRQTSIPKDGVWVKPFQFASIREIKRSSK